MADKQVRAALDSIDEWLHQALGAWGETVAGSPTSIDVEAMASAIELKILEAMK